MLGNVEASAVHRLLVGGVMDEPAGLGERGSSIFQSMANGVTDPARLALITEAARQADRLDELDGIIQGKGVLNLMQFRVLDPYMNEGTTTLNVEVKFNMVFAEARQQAVAFANVLKALGVDFKAAAVEPAVHAPAEAPKTGADMLAEQRAKRASGAG